MIILTDPNEVLGLIQQRVGLEYTIDNSSAIPEGEPDFRAKCILASMVWFPLNGDQSITLDEILNMKRGDKRIFFRKPVSVVQFECDSVWLGDVLNSIRSSGVKVELIEKVGQTVKRQWVYNQEVIKDDANDLVKVAMDTVSEYITFLPHIDKTRNDTFEFLQELAFLVDIKRKYQMGEVDSERLTGCVVSFNRRWSNTIQDLRKTVENGPQ